MAGARSTTERALDDDVLVARARRGDTAAFGVLVGRHQRAALRTAFAVGWDRRARPKT